MNIKEHPRSLGRIAKNAVYLRRNHREGTEGIGKDVVIPPHENYCYQCPQCCEYYDSETKHSCTPKERESVIIELTKITIE
jgi:hypothetical protein